jgi:MFS transporter, BCD family, chlorophyll transporter
MRRRLNSILARYVTGPLASLGPEWLPFADVSTAALPLSRLLRLALFQWTVGMAVVLVVGTLNRVMIVELGLSATMVGLMLALPLVFAPLRALVGYRSDTYGSFLGWRRVPFLWFGTMLQYGGLAIMPFALIILSGDSNGPAWIGPVAAAVAFLLVGAGLHMIQTAGLALACDLAPAEVRPKVVALLFIMLLIGMVLSAIVFGLLLADYSHLRLIQVVQGAAVVTVTLNLIALWKQEPRQPHLTKPDRETRKMDAMWAAFRAEPRAVRRLAALALGTAAFTMQDVLLEPYAGEVLKLSVAWTTALTAVFATGGIIGLGSAARWLGRGGDPYRVAGAGAVVGLLAFPAVMLSAPFNAPVFFTVGAGLIGLGGGLFAHATLTAAMQHAGDDSTGFALGVWGTVQATAAGVAIASGGALRDGIAWLASHNHLGDALAGPATGYGFVYLVEIILLFATLIAVGPLVGADARLRTAASYQPSQPAYQPS